MPASRRAANRSIESTYGSRSTIVRPHYVVGPGDSTDRFTYWVARVARGGQVLAPGSASDPLQYIDVRDLAAFMRRCAEQRPPGRFNACTPPGAHTMGELMETGKRVSGSNATFVWADAEFIQKNGLMEKGEIPIWLPPTGPLAGALLVSSARAVQQGLRFRDSRHDGARHARLAQQAPGRATPEAGCRPDARARSRVAEANGSEEGLSRTMAYWLCQLFGWGFNAFGQTLTAVASEVPASTVQIVIEVVSVNALALVLHAPAARLYEAPPLADARHRRADAADLRRLGRCSGSPIALLMRFLSIATMWGGGTPEQQQEIADVVGAASAHG